MQVTNNTSQDYWFGPLHLAANASNVTIDDTSATSLYLTDDGVADAINTLYAANKIAVTGAATPFPRPTGTPDVVHGDGSPEGLVYAGQGSLYLNRSGGTTGFGVYTKTSGIHLNTGWIALTQSASVAGDPATTLPTSPVDGQQAILTDSTSAPTYAWLFQYSSTASKWIFIGGTSAYVAVNASESTTSNVYGALTTAGPAFTLPRAGSYTVHTGAMMDYAGPSSNAGHQAFMSFDIGATGAVDANAVYGRHGTYESTSSPVGGAYSRTQTISVGSASTTLTAKYRVSSSAAANFDMRFMEITPRFIT